MKKTYTILLALASILAFNSCEESEISFLDSAEELGFTGSEADIINFLTEDAYNNLLGLGIPVHTGNTPPLLNGSYFMSPYVLESTNIENDFEIGYQFADNVVQVSNQNNEDLSLNYYSYQIDENGNQLNQDVGVASFISGEGNNFTIIVKVEGLTQGSEGNSISTIKGIAISGSLVNGFVQNMEHAFVFIEKNGDVNNELIEVGEGRLIVDGDGISESF